MLYISRRVNLNQYGVADTDDDTEEVAWTHELVQYVSVDKLTIHGVESMEHIEPFQPVGTASVLQSKLKMLKGIGIVVYKGRIVDITADSKMLSKPERVRVSDFGIGFENMALYGCLPCENHIMTLVFDDKVISAGSYCFSTNHMVGSVVDIGLKIDLKEVLNEELAYTIYRALIRDFNDPYLCVIDHRSRMIRNIRDAESEVFGN